MFSTLPCSKTISAPTLLRGGNSESMWNMMMGTNLVQVVYEMVDCSNLFVNQNIFM